MFVSVFNCYVSSVVMLFIFLIYLSILFHFSLLLVIVFSARRFLDPVIYLLVFIHLIFLFNTFSSFVICCYCVLVSLVTSCYVLPDFFWPCDLLFIFIFVYVCFYVLLCFLLFFICCYFPCFVLFYTFYFILLVVTILLVIIIIFCQICFGRVIYFFCFFLILVILV